MGYGHVGAAGYRGQLGKQQGRKLPVPQAEPAGRPPGCPIGASSCHPGPHTAPERKGVTYRPGFSGTGRE